MSEEKYTELGSEYDQTNLNDLEPTPDTQPPPKESNGFLEQFSAFSSQSLTELEQVATQVLNGTERMTLIKTALQLLMIAADGAKEEDFTPEMKAEIESLLTSLPNY